MYKVNLELFEGPLDLLLFLIRKNEVDIHDIPIFQLNQEYLEYLTMMEELDRNIAGEFLVMAAHLMLIKSRMLLPAPETGDDEQMGEEDPRAELVQRLLEYKQFKDAAEQFQDMEHQQRNVFGRLGASRSMAPEKKTEEEVQDNSGLEVNLFDLLKAFQKILAELPAETVREIQ